MALGAIYCALQISIADIRRRIIPDVYLFPLLLIGFIFITYFDWFISPQLGAISAALAYAMTAIIGYLFEKSNYIKKQKNSYPPIGMGDIKLLAVGGLWLGMTGLSVAIIAATLISAIWGWRQKQRFIPFAPFFFIGAILSLLSMAFLI